MRESNSNIQKVLKGARNHLSNQLNEQMKKEGHRPLIDKANDALKRLEIQIFRTFQTGKKDESGSPVV